MVDMYGVCRVREWWMVCTVYGIRAVTYHEGAIEATS
jgi:hypothetical protein